MPDCGIEVVYFTIQHLKHIAGDAAAVTIEAIAKELSMNKDLVIENVNALKILELIRDYDDVNEKVVA